MIIGSHNSFTYLKPKNFWYYFCIPFARCQNKTFLQQLEGGIRLFDIRVRFDKSGKNIILCHGLFEMKHYHNSYKEFILNIFETINFYNFTSPDKQKANQCVFRLILETSKENIIQESYFKNFCKYFSDNIYLTNIKTKSNHSLLSCVRKFDWKQLYKDSNVINLKDFQHISSYSVYPESIKVRWYEKICPYLYAKRTNKLMRINYSKNLYKSYDVILYDFCNI